MKMSFVLDASAVVKWFVEEDESDDMRKIRKLYLEGKINLYVPSLLFVELANALRYIRGLTSADVINSVRALRILRLNIVDNMVILEEAIKEAFSHNITVYDAIYVALAKTTNSKLVTYDKKLLSMFGNIAKKASQVLSKIKS